MTKSVDSDECELVYSFLPIKQHMHHFQHHLFTVFNGSVA